MITRINIYNINKNRRSYKFGSMIFCSVFGHFLNNVTVNNRRNGFQQ